MGPSLIRTVALVGAVVVGLSGCSHGPVDIQRASVSPDGRTLQLIVGACNADLTAVVEESEDTVEITVTARNESQNTCAEGIQVTLDSELGDRSVIDGSDGDALEVQPMPG